MNTNNSLEKDEVNEENATKSSDLFLLSEYIRCNSDSSRWSSAITLFISLTAASLIAFLGSFVSFQDPDSLAGSDVMAERGTIAIQTDSVGFFYKGTSNLDWYRIKPKVKAFYPTLLLKSESKDSTCIQYLESLTKSDADTLVNTSSECATPKGVNEGGGSIDREITNGTINGTKSDADTLVNTSSECATPKGVNEGGGSIDRKITNDTINWTKLNYIVERDSKSSEYPSPFQFLFSSITFLGLIFSLYFYILRRDIEKKIMELTREIEKREVEYRKEQEKIAKEKNEVNKISKTS